MLLRQDGQVQTPVITPIECNPDEIVVPEPKFNSVSMRHAMSVSFEDMAKLGTLHEVVDKGVTHKHIHVQRGGKVLGVAHLDSVRPFKNFWLSKSFVGCPTIDNRLGLWVIMYGLRRMGITLDLLLCDEEEKGKSTSQDFVLPAGVEYNSMVSFDRTGVDCALYQYLDKPFVELLKPFGIAGVQGAYSDIDSAGHLGIRGLNMGCGMYDYHSDAAYANLNELALQMKRYARFHKVYGEVRLPYDQPKHKQFHRTRNAVAAYTYYHVKPWAGEAYDDGYNPPGKGKLAKQEDFDTEWEEWNKRQDETAAAKKKGVDASDARNASVVYHDLEKYGTLGVYFAHSHPLVWANRTKLPKSAHIDWNAGVALCGGCRNKFNTTDTKWCFTMKCDLCRYCFCVKMEKLKVMPEDWYELAATKPLEEHSNADGAEALPY